MSNTPFELEPGKHILVITWPLRGETDHADYASFADIKSAGLWAAASVNEGVAIVTSLEDFNGLVKRANDYKSQLLLVSLHDIARQISRGTPVAGPDVFHFEPGMPFFAISWHPDRPELTGKWVCLPTLEDVVLWLKYTNLAFCRMVVSSLAEYHALMAISQFAGGSLLLTMKDYEASVVRRDMKGG